MPSINFVTKVITVPQSELTLISAGIYQLDANEFRLDVLDIMDGPGIPYPDPFRHNTTVLLGGVTYPRFIEIINGYTLTFEDGQYAVRIVGANTNFEDVTNVNQVSIRSANSAGLVQVSSGSGLSNEQSTQLSTLYNATTAGTGATAFSTTALANVPATGGAGLGPDELARLERIENQLIADVRKGASRYQRLLPGTETVILDKDVAFDLTEGYVLTEHEEPP